MTGISHGRAHYFYVFHCLALLWFWKRFFDIFWFIFKRWIDRKFWILKFVSLKLSKFLKWNPNKYKGSNNNTKVGKYLTLINPIHQNVLIDFSRLPISFLSRPVHNYGNQFQSCFFWHHYWAYLHDCRVRLIWECPEYWEPSWWLTVGRIIPMIHLAAWL